jgi:hypothetical protein
MIDGEVPNYLNQYYRLLNKDAKAFNKKVGYFTYALKNMQALNKHLRND